MASVYNLFHDAIHMEDSIVERYEQNNAVERRRHFAALKIQKHFRGFLTRNHIKRLHKYAILIQKTFRGWLARYHLPDRLHEYYDRLFLDHINKSAAKIQATWKGYSFRKYEVCIKDIREERALREKANEEMQMMLRLQRELLMGGVQAGIKPQNINLLENIIEVCIDRHHLLSTKRIRGVLSAPQHQELSELEKIIKTTTWTDYMRKLRKIYRNSAMGQDKEDQQIAYQHPKLRRYQKLMKQRDPNMEPPPPPCYTKQKNDFYLYSGLIKREPYQRMLTTSDKYRKPITAVVRSTDRSKNICEQDFDLNTLKMAAKEAEVPPYYVDFWLTKCKVHNL